jgi:hypothetical protein
MIVIGHAVFCFLRAWVQWCYPTTAPRPPRGAEIMGLVIALVSVGIVCGVILALHFTSKRPINVNIDARAEAHGGSAYTSSGTGSDSGGGVVSAIASLLKLALITAIAVFALSAFLNLASQKTEAPKVIVNVPTQIPQPAPNVIVQVPTQPAPVVNVPKQAPPVVNVPVATSPLETIGLIIGAIASVITIIVSIKMLRLLKAQDQPTAQPQYPIEYERTSYGWTPKKQAPTPVTAGRAIKADDIAPGLFNQKVEKK